MGWFPFTGKRPSSAGPAVLLRPFPGAPGERNAPTLSSISANVNTPAFLPKTHGKAAPHVTPLVVPIVREQRWG
jgi:hypothetical protein